MLCHANCFNDSRKNTPTPIVRLFSRHFLRGAGKYAFRKTLLLSDKLNDCAVMDEQVFFCFSASRHEILLTEKSLDSYHLTACQNLIFYLCLNDIHVVLIVLANQIFSSSASVSKRLYTKQTSGTLSACLVCCSQCATNLVTFPLPVSEVKRCVKKMVTLYIKKMKSLSPV